MKSFSSIGTLLKMFSRPSENSLLMFSLWPTCGAYALITLRTKSPTTSLDQDNPVPMPLDVYHPYLRLLLIKMPTPFLFAVVPVYHSLKPFNDSYSETKADAEKLVMRANGRYGLLTCCIRPSSIFGPGDKLLVPSLVAAARAGKSKYIIGDGNNYYDFTYVENVAYGHVCADKTLSSEDGANRAAGKAYFVTNVEPIKFWEFMSLILDGLGYQRYSLQ
ncbi:unnamed protein product [Triticum turgidum subsp. durum]|uniref:3-beta hydroxysteroid dehydrogenase/isomerase domain-containing protein n=1 Tax=Triticum turgidum subsp. durum TaxID=4567 RepID=A0A9R0SAH9_TRITD|nr:unnamed protein product [Triticum turgidum subsp. durum]